MASQMGSVSGIRRRPGSYVDQINSQRAFIPQMIAQKSQQKYQQDMMGINERGLAQKAEELGLQKRGLDLQGNQIAEMARSNAAPERYNTATLDLGQRTLNYNKEAAGKEAGLGMLTLATNMGNAMSKGPASGTATSGFGKFMESGIGGGLKSAAVGGLAGFGAAKAFGGKSKMRRAMIGTGAGLLSGFLSGGNMSSFVGGGLGGALGGFLGR